MPPDSLCSSWQVTLPHNVGGKNCTQRKICVKGNCNYFQLVKGKPHYFRLLRLLCFLSYHLLIKCSCISLPIIDAYYENSHVLSNSQTLTYAPINKLVDTWMYGCIDSHGDRQVHIYLRGLSLGEGYLPRLHRTSKPSSLTTMRITMNYIRGMFLA